MHVAMTAIFDPSTMQGGYEFQAIKDFIESRLHLVPPFRRRIVSVPFRLEPPDLGGGPGLRPRLPHPSHRSPEPRRAPGAGRGGRADRQHPTRPEPTALGAVRRRGPGRRQHRCGHEDAPLRRGRRVGCGADGQPVRPRPRRAGARSAGAADAGADPVRHADGGPRRRLPGSSPARDLRGSSAPRPAPSPRWCLAIAIPTPSSGPCPSPRPTRRGTQPITPHRRLSFTRVSLDDVKTIKNAVGCTVNDVILGLMGGTLRRYLEKHGGNPDEPLIAVCPVSVRGDDEKGQMNNKVSAMFTSLATDVDDPIERLRTINLVTRGAKEDHNALGANLLQDWAEHAAPTTFALAARLYSSLNLAMVTVRSTTSSSRTCPVRRSRSTTRAPRSSTRCRWAPSWRAPGSTSPCCRTWTTSTSGSWPAASWCRTCGTWPTTSQDAMAELLAIEPLAVPPPAGAAAKHRRPLPPRRPPRRPTAQRALTRIWDHRSGLTSPHGVQHRRPLRAHRRLGGRSRGPGRRETSGAATASSRRGPTGSPTTSRPRASGRATTSASTAPTASSGSRRRWPPTRCGPCP